MGQVHNPIIVHKYTTEAQNIIKEIKHYQKKWLKHVQRMDTKYQNKHYSINPKDAGHRKTEEETEVPNSS